MVSMMQKISALEKKYQSKQELADDIGVDRITLYYWRTGKYQPSKLATMRIDDLFKTLAQSKSAAKVKKDRIGA